MKRKVSVNIIKTKESQLETYPGQRGGVNVRREQPISNRPDNETQQPE